MQSLLLGIVFFRTALTCCAGYYLEGGLGWALHDAVGINCKRGATTENQGADDKYIYTISIEQYLPNNGKNNTNENFIEEKWNK